MAAKQKPKKEKNPEAVEIGERLRDRREDLGLSRKAVSAQLKSRNGKSLDWRKYGQYEQGQNIPHPERRRELADILRTTPAALFGDLIPESTTLKRIDLLEGKVNAIIEIEGLDAEVERWLRKARQREREQAQREASRAADKAKRAAQEPLKAPQPKRRRRRGS